MPYLPGKGKIFLLLAVFIAAVSYRLICFNMYGDHPLFSSPVVDARYHHLWGERIKNGDLFGHGPDDVFKPPLYPYFIAAIYQLSGSSVPAVLLIQLLLGGVSSILIAALGSRLINLKTGITAGFLYALYAPFVFFELQLLTPVLGIFLNLCFLLILVRPEKEKRSIKNLLASGFFLGLSACVRPDILLPGIITGLIFIIDFKKKAFLNSSIRFLLFITAVIITISPVTIRNYHLTGEFIPISANGGINFYIGNCSVSDGVSAVPVGLQWERFVSTVPQDILNKPSLSSQLWLNRALDEIRQHPQNTISLFFKKLRAFFSFHEFRNNISFSFMQKQCAFFKLPFLQFAIILCMAFPGIWILHRKRKKIDPGALFLIICWTLGFMAIGLLFFVTARFRIPLVPVLILPASALLVDTAGGLAAKNYVRAGRNLLLCSIFGIIFLTAGNGMKNDWTRDYINTGNALMDLQRYKQAQDSFQQAVSSKNDPDAHFLLATLLFNQKKMGAALLHAEKCLAMMPDSPDVLLLMAKIHLSLHHPYQSGRMLRKIIELAARSNLYPKKNEWAQAYLMLSEMTAESTKRAALLEKAWSISPPVCAEFLFLRGHNSPRVMKTFENQAIAQHWDWYAQANYAMSLQAAKKHSKAVISFNKAIQLAPDKNGIKDQLQILRSRSLSL